MVFIFEFSVLLLIDYGSATYLKMDSIKVAMDFDDRLYNSYTSKKLIDSKVLLRDFVDRL